MASAAALGAAERGPLTAPASAAPEPRRIAIAPQPRSGALHVTVGRPIQLSARLELADGTTLALDEQVSWSTSDPSVVRVGTGRNGEPPGRLTPVRPGVAGITVIYPPIVPPASPRRAQADPPHATSRALGDSVTVVVRER